MKISVILCAILFTTVTLSNQAEKISEKNPRGIIKTCSCSLSKYEDLKNFLEYDLSEYGDLLKVVYEKSNSLPKLLMYDEEGNETGMVILDKMSRKQIRMLLKEISIEPYFALEEL